MKIHLFSAIVLGLAVGTACAQDANTASPQVQSSGQDSGQGPGAGSGGGYGRRGGRGGFGGGMGMGGGRGTMGTVTETAADHYTLKTDTGEVYTVHFSVNTRIVKMGAGGRGSGGGGGQRGEGDGRMSGGGNPPVTLKPTDIKVGDVVTAMGEVDAAAKSVGAVAIMQLDPERVKQIHEMQANYGKTWLMGKVTAVDGVKVTLMGSVDNASHSFVADENTTFRRRRDPITLADIQVGDTVRVEGAVKDGAFDATTVAVMGMMPRETEGGARSVQPQ